MWADRDNEIMHDYSQYKKDIFSNISLVNKMNLQSSTGELL